MAYSSWDFSGGLDHGAYILDDLGINDFPFTFAAWIKQTDSLSTDHAIVEIGRNGSSYPRYLIDHDGSDIVATTARYQSSDVWLGGVTTISNNQWYHVAGVFGESAGAYRYVYVDGEEDNSGNEDVNGFNALSSAFCIGNRLYTWNRGYPGLIHGVAVWDIALSEAQIESLSNGTCPLDIESDHLVGYWPGDYYTDGGTDYLEDFSGNGHDLEIVGATQSFDIPSGLLSLTTLAPTTLSPTTIAPTTLAPTTLAPTTLEPTTIAPTTLSPTTLEPTTLSPTTVSPTTVSPTTLSPTTVAPTTAAPTSLAPTTLAPTTVMPTTVVPTTLVPTTLAPTTVLLTTPPPTTLAPTTFLTTLAPPDPIEITVDPIDLYIDISAYFSYYPPAPKDPSLDRFYTVDPIDITISIDGYYGNIGLEIDPIDIYIDIIGDIVSGVIITPDPIDLTTSIHFTDIVLSGGKSNFVKWSKIGHLDFTIDESNIAGERPMDWRGTILAIKKLRDFVVVYGNKGISIMRPSGVFWGLERLHHSGLKNKGAMTGTDFEHFFVDTRSHLIYVGEKPIDLDYSEYLSQMGETVLSIDLHKRLLYICDGTVGYIYSIDSKSFGGGPVNVSGVGMLNSDLYSVSPTPIVVPKFEIVTNIYDFGTRKPKTIRSIEFGTNLTDHLYTTVYYRTNYNSDFTKLSWYLVNPDGKAYPVCYGVEFKFAVKSYIKEEVKIDYMKIRGNIHGYSYVDIVTR